MTVLVMQGIRRSASGGWSWKWWVSNLGGFNRMGFFMVYFCGDDIFWTIPGIPWEKWTEDSLGCRGGDHLNDLFGEVEVFFFLVGGRRRTLKWTCNDVPGAKFFQFSSNSANFSPIHTWNFAAADRDLARPNAIWKGLEGRFSFWMQNLCQVQWTNFLESSVFHLYIFGPCV